MTIRVRSKPTEMFAKGISKFSKVELKRAVDAVQKVGLEIGRVDIRPDGTISMRTVSAVCDQSDTLFDQWADKT